MDKGDKSVKERLSKIQSIPRSGLQIKKRTISMNYNLKVNDEKTSMFSEMTEKEKMRKNQLSKTLYRSVKKPSKLPKPTIYLQRAKSSFPQ